MKEGRSGRMVKDNETKLIEEKDIDTVLAEDIDFSGTMKFKNSLMIKGKFDGQIDAVGHLILGPEAVVKATIKAGIVTNYGKIYGNVEAIKKLELLKGAELNGDVKTPDLIVESGCIFNGKCTMTPQGEAAAEKAASDRGTGGITHPHPEKR
ncbi:MAG: bactofilin family protein [Spirochaetota bacterium]